MKKLLPFFAVCLILAACEGPPLPSHDMSPAIGLYAQLPHNPEFNQNIQLGNVQIGKGAENNTAPVKVKNYTEALQQALLSANFAVRSQSAPTYILDVSLTDLDVSSFGFSVDSSAKASYQLKRADTNRVVLAEVIMLPAHVPFSFALDRYVRSRMAAAKAIQENITHFIRLLASKTMTL